MMKILRFGLIAAFAGVLVTGCSGDDEPFGLMQDQQQAVEAPAAATMPAPVFNMVSMGETVTLYAGQTTPVGDVHVYNDGTNLYIEVDLYDDICITESHLAIEESEDDIPQANGNPIPGQFPYSLVLDDPDGCDETPDPFSIGLDQIGSGLSPGNGIVVALHVVSVDLTQQVEIPVASDGTEMVYGPLVSYAAPGDAAWGAGGTAVLVAPGSINSAWCWEFDTGSWISRVESAAPDDPNVDEWLLFKESVEIPEGVYAPQLTIRSQSDNAEGFFLNGTFGYASGTYDGTELAPDGEPIRGAFRCSDDPEDPKDYTFDLAFGTNDLEYIVRNYFPENIPAASNPTALVYSGEVTYYKTETAWAGTTGCEDADRKSNGIGCDFPGNNWATYINYTIQGCPVPTVNSGDVDIMAQLVSGDDVSLDEIDQDRIKVYPESFTVLSSDLTGWTSVGSTDSRATVSAGSVVCSYYVLFDPSGESGNVTVAGNLTFAANPVAFFGTKPENDDCPGDPEDYCDPYDYLDGTLGVSGVTYNDGPLTGIEQYYRWLEREGDRQDEVAISGGDLSIGMQTGRQWWDAFRVLTPPSVPPTP